MSNFLLTKQEQEILQKAIREADDIILFQDDCKTHGLMRFKNGYEMFYINNLANNSFVIDLEMTIKANGGQSLEEYLSEKPYMLDNILDGINKGILVI